MNTTKSSFDVEPFKKDTKNDGNLPNYIIYIELYDFKERKKLLSHHHLSFTDFSPREIELECTNKILKFLSSKREKNSFIFKEARKSNFKWSFYINKKDIGTAILFVAKEEDVLIKNYSKEIQKIFENTNTDSEDFKKLLKTNFKDINKILNNSDNVQRDVNYAIQKMNKVLLKAEQTKEQLNRIDEKVKEVHEEADEYRGNSNGIRNEASWVNKKLGIVLGIFFVFFVIGVAIYFYLHYGNKVAEGVRELRLDLGIL